MRGKAVVLLAVVFATAGVVAGGDAKADLKKFAGTWSVVSAVKGGKEAPETRRSDAPTPLIRERDGDGRGVHRARRWFVRRHQGHWQERQGRVAHGRGHQEQHAGRLRHARASDQERRCGERFAASARFRSRAASRGWAGAEGRQGRDGSAGRPRTQGGQGRTGHPGHTPSRWAGSGTARAGRLEGVGNRGQRA